MCEYLHTCDTRQLRVNIRERTLLENSTHRALKDKTPGRTARIEKVTQPHSQVCIAPESKAVRKLLHRSTGRRRLKHADFLSVYDLRP
ncbi:hypothetical protein POSPLADRAFT_1039723 [Postia placenta MAD-698-R-SB12]|uniref:Uncharacterized protein n=1 Tax=Postia placenta MAD-698-R-SB12 TaxID=670580 RepID=A0A1X6N2D3_9APHY|nr:hypothetical protein POSPLADRAFT_1039723 [Postia placenta MAD-698-R-SB12]OSX62754.1 hypothetical protein POSPLADRAFT_1039723 [Postia placenta MAD-698-R-SB12]